MTNHNFPLKDRWYSPRDNIRQHDSDGFTNIQEYQKGTNPNVSDAQAFPLWILGAAAAVIIGLAAAITIFWRRRK